MADTERTVRVKFDGSSRGLDRAAAAAERRLKKWQRGIDKASRKAGADAGLDAGDGFGLSFLARLGPIIAKAPINGPLAALAVAAAPTIAAALTSGILLALGGGALAAGIVAAAQNPKVSAAFAKFGDRAKKAFANFGKPFEGPLIRAADTFGDAIERLAPAFKRIGVAVAPLIDKLAPALANMFEKAMPGIEEAVKASIPLFEKIAEHAPAIGEAISKFLSAVAKGAPGAISFMDRLFKTIEFALPLIGSTIQNLTAVAEQGMKLYDRVVTAISGLWRKLKSGAADVSAGVSSAWRRMATAAASVRDAVVSRFNSMVSFVRGIPGRVSGAFSGMFDGVKAAFRSALNWVIDRWNNFSIPGLSTPFGTIGGFNTPNIPHFATGGMSAGGLAWVGERGRELVRLPRGSQVFSHADSEGMVGDTHVTVIIDGRALDSSVVRVVRERDRDLKRRTLAGTGAAR